jgi:Protein of unknown function (DUF1573)
MKKILLILIIAFGFGLHAIAQNITPPTKIGLDSVAPVPLAPVVQVYDFNKFMKLNKTDHDFGTIKQLPEGVTTTFIINNFSTDSIFILRIETSCGCTIPKWDTAPIPPGKTGKFTAKYTSLNRPNGFNKQLTIVTTRGSKVVTIRGVVEPTSTDNPLPITTITH